MKRKALGKGLRSLIPQAPPPAPPAEVALEAPELTGGLREIDLDLIHPSHRQPREAFNEDALAELAASFKDAGVLQPVVVRPGTGGRFELVAGERRWRAAQLAGLLKIPAVIKDVRDEQLVQYSLIENLQREGLNPVEEAQAYRTLSTDFGLTQQEIAERTGKRRTTIANVLRLLALPNAVQDKLRVGQLSTGHAKLLLSIERPGQQVELAERVVREGLSVRQLERLISSAAVPRKPSPRPATRDPNVVAAEEELQRSLGTRVRIFQGKQGAGRIELHCASASELERVYQTVLRASASAGPATQERNHGADNFVGKRAPADSSVGEIDGG